MEGNSAAVSGMRPPRFERNRGRRFVGCGVAVLAAVLCASLFTAPARGEDPPSPVPDGSAMTTDSTPSDAAATAPSAVIAPTETSDTSAPATDSPGTADATDTRAPAPDATDTSATMAGGSVAAVNTAGAGTPAPDAIDTSATSTDTSAAAADPTRTRAPAPVPTDTTDGLTATDPSASSPDASAVGPTDAAADSFTITADPTGTSTGTAPAMDTRSLSSASSSGVAEPPASPPGSSSHPPSDATASDALSEATSNDDDADTDSFPGELVQPFATAVHHGEAMTLIFAVLEIRCGADCGITIVCDPSPRSLPLASCSTKPEATRAGRIEVRTNGPENRRPAGARGPSAPRLPIPDHEPQVPTAPGASSGSGSSGGPHGGSTIGVTSAVLGITPRDGTRPIALIELCRRALPLAFLLDRPG
jgi:hypothetical protein